MTTIKKPEKGEFKPFTRAYIDLVPDDGKVLQHLDEQLNILQTLITPLSQEQLDYRYAEGKWNIKEMLVHMIDTERIFAVRALRIARNDKANMPGFQQDDFVPYSAANDRSASDIIQEFGTVRAATLSLFNSFNKEQLQRIGTADGHPVSVRALAYMTAGHASHHINLIKERYL